MSRLKGSKNKKNAKPVQKLIAPEPMTEEKDNELELLALMCSVIENWTPEQRRRNLSFLADKYSEYIPKM